MRTSKDPRHLKRIKIMQELFSWDFSPENRLKDRTAKEIGKNKEKIDVMIAKAAPAWPIEKVNKIDLAILRLAVFELLIAAKAPAKVIVDEAVEIAKNYGSDSSPSFINGVLGKLIDDQNISTS